LYSLIDYNIDEIKQSFENRCNHEGIIDVETAHELVNDIATIINYDIEYITPYFTPEGEHFPYGYDFK